MIGIDLSSKVALITGASGGLGAETARLFAAAGAAVAVNYHGNRKSAEEVVSEVRAAGGTAEAFQADVTDPDSVAAMLAETRRLLGPVTILVNNAGREEAVAAPFEMGWADYQKMIDLNLKAIYNTASQAHPDMKAAGWGRIVNIGSVAFTRPFPGSSAYTAAKGAMLGMTRGLAMELGPDGITVNNVAPGWIPVERHASAPAEAFEKLVRETPLGRQGRPDEVASVILFLCSDLASFISGAQVPVNGGHTFFT